MAKDLSAMMAYGSDEPEAKPAEAPAPKASSGKLSALMAYGNEPEAEAPAEDLRTKLSPKEEKGFQAWRATLPERLQSDSDYDLRGFYKKNPTFKLGGPDAHLTDEFKLPNHETFSNESRYYNDKTAHLGGHWEQGQDGGWAFVPNDTNYKRRIVEDKNGNRVEDHAEQIHASDEIFGREPGRKAPKGFERLAAAADLPEKGTPVEPDFPERAPPTKIRGGAEAAGHELSNLFGVGPIIAAGADTLVSQVPYARDLAQNVHSEEFPPLTDPNVSFSERRAAYARALDESREQHPGITAATSALRTIPETIIARGAGRFIGPALEEVAPAVKALSPVAKAALAGGAYGAGTGVGEGLSHGEGAGDIATRALVGGGLGAGGGALVAKGGQLVRETGKRVAKAVGKLKPEQVNEVADLARRDPEVAKALTTGAKKGATIIGKRVEDMVEAQAKGATTAEGAKQLSTDIETAELLWKKLSKRAEEKVSHKSALALALTAAQEGLFHQDYKRAAAEFLAALGVPKVGTVAGRVANRAALSALRNEGNSAFARTALKALEKGLPLTTALKLAQEGAQGRTLEDVGHVVGAGIDAAAGIFGAPEAPEPAPEPSTPPDVSPEPADE